VTQTTALDTTPIIDEAQVVELLANLGPTVSLAEPLVLADQISVTNASVGYYEMPMGETQSRLVPVYILDSSYQLSGAEVLTAGLYLPAAPSLMNPLAAITSYTQTTPIIAVGDILTLTAADAAQPLSVLGYGDSLDFALGQGPYTYTWRLGTTGKVIGQGLSTTYRAGIEDHLGMDKENDVPLTIVLEVTDAAGHTSATARQFYFASITPVQRVRLPLVLRSR
jgi:hypothetical protein